MKLYLARHGDYTVDLVKQLDVLTDLGINQITKIANCLKQANIQVANIYHSNKHRAEQTAALLAKGVHCDQNIQLYSGINPNDEIAAFVNEIPHWDKDVLVVGHQPFMNKLVSHLIVGNENKNIIDFHTGTVACIEGIDRERWIINWVITPALFL